MDRALDSSAPAARRGRPTGGGPSAVERATAYVRNAILIGRLEPGESLNLSTLAAELGISHIPVREAIRRLESNGLVVARPGRQPVVAALSRDELESIYRLRLRIEPDLSVEASRHFSPVTLDALYAMLDDEWRMDDPADEQWQQHCRFHAALLEPALTPVDRRVLDQLWHASERYTRIVFETHGITPATWHQRVERHRHLIEAIASGEAELVRQSVVEHLESSLERCRRAFP